MNEAVYQRKLIKKINQRFPECHILKNDPSETQGIPDLLILCHNKWAMLETKISEDAPVQPNQSYHILLFNDMSFASFINPQNEEEVLHQLESAFGGVT